MKQLLLLFILIVGTEYTMAQNSITDAEALLLTASEGDLYKATPSGSIYIGLASGAYQAFDTNIYKTNWILSNNREIDGNNFDLHFTSINNFRTSATNSTQINTTAGFTELWGSSGIILYDATTFESSIWAKAGIKDTSGDFGADGQILSSTPTGTDWIDGNFSITNTVEGSGLILAIVKIITTNTEITTTLTPDHYTVILQGSKAHTIVLPSAPDIGLIFNIKNLSTENANIDSYTDGQGVVLGIVEKEKMLILQFDGTDWQQIN